MSVDLDREIDRTVRSMLDREPSPALRARVVAALRSDAPRRAWMAWGGPLAAVTTVVLLVTLTAVRRAPVSPSVRHGRDAVLPAAITRTAEQPPVRIAAPAPRARTEGGAQPRGEVRAASIDESAAVAIDALDAPSPLSIRTIPSPASAAMSSIQPAPLRVDALDLPALELPRDAARGEDR